jgi:hypothetical protein
MSHYVIEENLTTNSKQRTLSAVISIFISVGIVGLLYFMKIVVPNPPFEMKTGELQLDFGAVEEVSFGRPNDGGPSDVPPAKGGGDGASEPQTTNSPTPSGGLGQIVNTTDNTEESTLPPIDPPASKTPASNSRLSKLNLSGRKSGAAGPGSPNGIEGGSGSNGFGPGGNNGGITGMGGTRVTQNRGNGLFTAKGFASHQILSDVKKVNAEGTGTIEARIEVGCNGVARIKSMLPTGNYTGGLANAREVMNYFLSKSRFEKIGDKCPETGSITLNIKSEGIQ